MTGDNSSWNSYSIAKFRNRKQNCLCQYRRLSLQSLSVLSSPLDCSQLTFSLFWIHLFSEFCFISNWASDDSWTLLSLYKKLLSETAIFCRSIFASASFSDSTSFQTKVLLLYGNKLCNKTQQECLGLCICLTGFFHSIHILIEALYVFSLVTWKIQVKIFLIPITEIQRTT